MARISFKQGIIRHQTDINDNPTFLQKVGNDVNLVISQDQTIITFVHGSKNYMFTESVTQNAAWGPFSTGIDYWLYWDLNRVTGVRTFGHTGYEPVTASVAPATPAIGQMWFNSTSNLMYEFNGASWVEVIRVFSCKLEGGITFISMSIDSPLFTGTQVGLTTTSNIGSLVFDNAGNPIFNGFGKFFTTEDVFTTGVPTGASLKINNILIRAQALQPIASYHVVTFSDYNKVLPAAAFSIMEKVYGIIEEDVITSEVVNIITEGIIFNENWDWPTAGGAINDPLFIDGTGQITLIEQVPNQIAVGAIVGPQSILFSPGIYGATVEGTGGTTDHGLLIGLEGDDHTQYFNSTRGDIRYYEKTVANTTFAPSVHTHVKADITDFAHTHAEYVDVAGDTMTGFLTLHADPTTALHAATKAYVDALAQGLGPKESVRAASTVDVGGTYNPTGGTGTTGEFTGVDVTNIDGISLDVADRVLIKDQTDDLQNGVYVVTTAGVAGVIERSEDMDGSPSTEIQGGHFVFVEQGTTQTQTGWVIVGQGERVPNVDPIVWTQFSGGGELTPGTNIEIVGSVINVSPQGIASSLDADLWDGEQSDITTPATGETLVYDGVDSWDNGYSTRITDSAGTTSVTTDVVADTLVLTSTAIEVRDSVAANGATMKLYEGSTNGVSSVEIGAPAALAGDTVFTFPPTNGTVDQILRTDGNGVTTWVDAAAGSSFCLIDGDADTFVAVGFDDYTGVPCTDADGNIIRIQTGNNAAEPSGPIQIYTGDNAEAGQLSGVIDIKTGTPGYNGSAGGINIEVGKSNGSGNGSHMTISGGDTDTGTGGNIVVITGQTGDPSVPATGRSGSLTLETGLKYFESNTTATGDISIATGDARVNAGSYSASTGNIDIKTGQSYGKYNGGTSGTITVATSDGDRDGAIQNTGAMDFNTGDSGYLGGAAGNFTFRAGHGKSTSGTDATTGGRFSAYCGNSNGTGNAGRITLSSGDHTNATQTGNAGRILITGGEINNTTLGLPGYVELRSRGTYMSGNITLIAEGGFQQTALSSYHGGNVDLMPGSNGSVAQQAHVRLFRQSVVADVLPEMRFQLSTRAQAELPKYVALRAPDSVTTGPSYRITLPANDDAMEDGTMLVSNASGDLQFQQAPYDINIQGFGALTNGDILGRYMAPRAIVLKDIGHIGLAQTAPVTTDATFTVYTSTGAGALTSIGTIVFAAASQTVTSASFTTDRAIAIGDVITIECTTASSIEDVTITLLGKLAYI